MIWTLTGPTIVTPGVAYVYTICGYGICMGTGVQGTPGFPAGWIIVNRTPIVGNCYTITVIAGSTPPSSGFITILNCGCYIGESLSEVGSPQLGGVSIGNSIQSNIGICCSQFATATLDTSKWTNNVGSAVTLTITFGNHVDATAALGAYAFTSTSNISLQACLSSLVTQINAAATANPSGNPEGLTPASLIAEQLTITSWPTANDATECGDTTNYLFGFEVTCNLPSNVTLTPITTANFSGGGNVINCIGPPSITGNPFACTGQQSVFTVTFPNGIPKDYTITPPNGWTLVSTIVSGTNTLLITLIPNSSSGTLTVSDSNGVTGYTTTLTLINDCFIANCAAKMLLSQFCHDIDPCCTQCDDFKKKEREVDQIMYNKAIALINMYSLAKQNYYVNCLTSSLPPILSLLNQISEILIRCQVCPQI